MSLKSVFNGLFWVLLAGHITNSGLSIANLIIHRSDLCNVSIESLYWWQKRTKICPLRNPMGSGLWATPLVMPVLLLLKLKPSHCKAGTLVALSILMLIVYCGGLFNEIQVFNAIQLDEDEGHRYSAQGMIVVALYLLSISFMVIMSLIALIIMSVSAHAVRLFNNAVINETTELDSLDEIVAPEPMPRHLSSATEPPPVLPFRDPDSFDSIN